MGNKLSYSNPVYPDVPLNEPPFRWSSELSYWDASLAGISDSSRKWMWLTLAILTMVANCFIGFVFTSIVIQPEARKKPYNLFLLFLMIPDIVFNGGDPFIYLMNYRAGRYVSVQACKLQGFLLPFGMLGNCQINGLIALELHRLLRHSYQRRRYFPPSPGTIVSKCLACYALVTCISLVYSLNFNALSMRTPLTGGGVFCSPAPYDLRSALVYFTFLGAFTLYIPIGICGFVTFDVLKRGLLPKKGEGKRALAIYFFRLLLVFLIFWTPTVLSAFVATNPWLSFVGAIWSHSQGAVSAMAMLGKSDILDCVKSLLSRVTWGLVASSPMGATVPAILSNQPNSTESSTRTALPARQSSVPMISVMDDFSQEMDLDPESPYLEEETTTGPTTPTPFENEPSGSETAGPS